MANSSVTEGLMSVNSGYSFTEIYEKSGKFVFAQTGCPAARQAFLEVYPGPDSASLWSRTWLVPAQVAEMKKCTGYQSWSWTLEGPMSGSSFDLEMTFLPDDLEGLSGRFVVRYEWLTPERLRIENLRTHMLFLARQACVGSLGGPIAHALNNPLATIRGFAEVLRRRFDKIEKVGYFSEKIVSNSDRMKETIEQLRSISRPRKEGVSSRNFNINELVNEALAILHEQFKMRSIDVDLNLDPQLPPMKGDLSLWEALLLSLLSSSRDSFAEFDDERKKKIFIETSFSGQKISFVYRDTAGGFPISGNGSDLNPLDALSSSDPSRATQAFVVLEVLKRHGVIAKFSVIPGDTTEITFAIDAAEFNMTQDSRIAV